VIIQNEASCVVFGMPGAVQAAGAYDRTLSPEEIIEALIEKVAVKPANVRGGLVGGA
jgi:chemotaxis response regulator CheB